MTVYTPTTVGLVHDTTSVVGLNAINAVLCMLSAVVVAAYVMSDYAQSVVPVTVNGVTVTLLAVLNMATL